VKSGRERIEDAARWQFVIVSTAVRNGRDTFLRCHGGHGLVTGVGRRLWIGGRHRFRVRATDLAQVHHQRRTQHRQRDKRGDQTSNHIPSIYAGSCAARGDHKRTLRSRSALLITDTELKVIAALASIGLSRMPVNG
jgi:hypothetical protein